MPVWSGRSCKTCSAWLRSGSSPCTAGTPCWWQRRSSLRRPSAAFTTFDTMTEQHERDHEVEHRSQEVAVLENDLVFWIGAARRMIPFSRQSPAGMRSATKGITTSATKRGHDFSKARSDYDADRQVDDISFERELLEVFHDGHDEFSAAGVGCSAYHHYCRSFSLPDRSSQQPYAHSRTDRTGGTCAPGSGTGEAWRLNQPETGLFRRPRRNLRWVGAKSADRDLLLPRLRQ